MTRADLERALGSEWMLVHFQPKEQIPGSSYAGAPVEASASYRAVRHLGQGLTRRVAEVTSRVSAEALVEKARSYDAALAARKDPPS